MNEQEIVELFFKKNYLLSPDFFEESFFESQEEPLSLLPEGENRPLILTKDISFILKKKKTLVEINWTEFEKSRVLFEKGRDEKIYQNFLDILLYDINQEKTKEIDSIT